LNLQLTIIINDNKALSRIFSIKSKWIIFKLKSLAVPMYLFALNNKIYGVQVSKIARKLLMKSFRRLYIFEFVQLT